MTDPNERPARTGRYRQRLQSSRAEHIDLLRTLCAIESGSEMVEGVRRVAGLVAERLEALGLQVQWHPAEGYADHLVATTAAARDAGALPIVLGGHLDTTYTDYAPLPPVHADGDALIGPGTADMRGGVIVFVAALDCLAAEGRLAAAPLTVVLNSDEERGATTSRQLLLQLAGRCQAALFSECAGRRGELVTSRRAKLSYRIDVAGVGMHAGTGTGEKASALLELAHETIAIEALNERFAGTSLNVGKAWGGVASNTVPPTATALIDIRYPDPQLEQPIRAAMEAVVARPTVARTRAELTETSYRPAWQPSPATRALFGRVETIAAQLGQAVAPEARGGTADANWFGARGVPTLDGLGPVGFDDHTPQERILTETLFERALLVALLIDSLVADPLSGY